jgi:hypothetical protein
MEYTKEDNNDRGTAGTDNIKLEEVKYKIG